MSQDQTRRMQNGRNTYLQIMLRLGIALRK